MMSTPRSRWLSHGMLTVDRQGGTHFDGAAQFFADEPFRVAGLSQRFVDALVFGEAAVVELLQLVAERQPLVPGFGVDREGAARPTMKWSIWPLPSWIRRACSTR